MMILSHRVLLRRFLLLKLATVLLFPRGAALPLVAGAVCSLQARSWLRRPHVSTKPSNVLLRQLALVDALLLLYAALRLADHALRLRAGVWAAAEDAAVVVVGPPVPKTAGAETSVEEECRRASLSASLSGQWLLDAHHLASLLLLGLLGLEATLVCRWPLQTRALRTSRFARLGCGLVWALVLAEVLVSQGFVRDATAAATAAGLLQGNNPPRALTTEPPPLRQHHAAALMSHHSLPTFSVYLRRALWLTDSWLHYTVLYGNKPKRAESCFH